MKCPKCGGSVSYYGLARKKNPSGSEVQLYKCGECDKTFGAEKTTDVPAKFKGAVKLYEEFNMKKADKVMMANLSLPGNDNPLVHLGKIAGIIYISDKEGKKGQQYIHDTHAPHPDFFVTADGKTFVIAGGKMVVKDGWLYY